MELFKQEFESKENHIQTLEKENHRLHIDLKDKDRRVANKIDAIETEKETLVKERDDCILRGKVLEREIEEYRRELMDVTDYASQRDKEVEVMKEELHHYCESNISLKDHIQCITKQH